MLARAGLALAAGALIMGAASAAEAPPAPNPAWTNKACTYGNFLADTWRPKPAFAGQTSAPAIHTTTPFKVEAFAEGLVHPWSLAFLPDGGMLVSERPGRMRIIGKDGRLGDPLTGLPPMTSAAGEGLHDIILDPDFRHNRLIYFTYFAPPAGEPARAATQKEWTAWLALSAADREAHKIGVERISRARLSDDGRSLEQVTKLLDGGDRRIVAARDGTLYVTAATTSGNGLTSIDGPQYLSNDYGKILRIRTDGSTPPDNPFVSKPGARAEIFALGFRDPEGAALNPATGELWTVEHGPRGGDELNVIHKGHNYGYPAISYGREYSQELINGGLTAKPGMDQPVYYWVPSIAPSGLLFYTGKLFPEWKGSLFLGSQAGRHLVRLTLKGGRVTGEERLLGDRCKRIRDVRQGPDGALYLLTDEDAGQVLRITPGS